MGAWAVPAALDLRSTSDTAQLVCEELTTQTRRAEIANAQERQWLQTSFSVTRRGRE